MAVQMHGPIALELSMRSFYQDTLCLLNDKQQSYLVGGAYALERYTGIARQTKDLDIFIRPEEYRPLCDFLNGEGYQTEVTHPHWLAKAFRQEHFIDIIFGSGNGLCPVDEDWFLFSVPDIVFDVPVLLCPVEEMVWSKSFIMERERFDGADVAHLLKARGRALDWTRLLERFAEHWPVLLAQLVLFRFIYPGETDTIPERVFSQLLQQAGQWPGEPDSRLCRGTLLSREQYLTDIFKWGYHDPRLAPRGNLSAEDIRHWTAAIYDR
jgi:hypothetical protein